MSPATNLQNISFNPNLSGSNPYRMNNMLDTNQCNSKIEVEYVYFKLEESFFAGQNEQD